MKICCFFVAFCPTSTIYRPTWNCVSETASNKLSMCLLILQLLQHSSTAHLHCCRLQPHLLLIVYHQELPCRLLCLRIPIRTSRFTYAYWTLHHCDSWRIRDQLDVTSYYVSFHFFYAQHVSDINTSIIRSLRLFYCITTLVECSCFDVCWSFAVVTRDIKLVSYSSTTRFTSKCNPSGAHPNPTNTQWIPKSFCMPYFFLKH